MYGLGYRYETPERDRRLCAGVSAMFGNQRHRHCLWSFHDGVDNYRMATVSDGFVVGSWEFAYEIVFVNSHPIPLS